MKKIVTILLALALTLGVASAYAAGMQKNFADANNDGVCDNQGARGCGRTGGMAAANAEETGANGRGFCYNQGDDCGRFADADNDGVCDNHGERCGRNFVDADNDGVCDNHGEHCGRGMMRRSGENAGNGKHMRGTQHGGHHSR